MSFRNSALYNRSNYYKSPWSRTIETEVWWLQTCRAPPLSQPTLMVHAVERLRMYFCIFSGEQESAEKALNSLIQIIDKDIKQFWPQSWLLGNSSSQLEVTPFATSCWALPSRQFFTQQKIHLPRPWTRRMVAGRVSLAKGICCAFLRWEGCNLTELQPMWGLIRTRRTGH